MVFAIVGYSFRLFIASEMEYEIHASPPSNPPPPNSFALAVCFRSTDRAIRIGSNFFHCSSIRSNRQNKNIPQMIFSQKLKKRTPCLFLNFVPKIFCWIFNVG